MDQQEHSSNEEIKEQTTESELSVEQQRIAELEAKVEELKHDYLRAQADIQNTIKRCNEEVKKSREYAISSFAKDLTEVKDYLEMALKDTSGNFEGIKMGVDLTLKHLISVFDSHKVKEINPTTGAKLDTNLHQAMHVVEEHEQEPDTVVSVMKKGYTLNDRVIRPAMVSVAK